MRQTIQLRNNSAKQTRVIVVPPTSRQFKARSKAQTNNGRQGNL